ncbi:hypothetical protein V1520DRAFT_347563 [Lipomyces starkeyi]|uniref:Uncharacterized protein n=1 Tax=Lipomyces starkeyi NRRL Y-11557 TaxID=675824 RepID=A0A1E3PUM7_LIPST|nr:hypothetical protein LIPSTDRAFT_76527 [Lipomyces starkeyi NRRL Y-11557]
MDETTSLLSRPRYDVSKHLVKRWGFMSAGVAKTVIISAAGVSTALVVNGCKSSQWNCFASMFFATALMAFTITAVGFAGSVSPVKREKSLPLFTQNYISTYMVFGNGTNSQLEKRFANGTSLPDLFSLPNSTFSDVHRSALEALGSFKAGFLHNTTTGINTIFVGMPGLDINSYKFGGPSSYHTPDNLDIGNGTVARRSTESVSYATYNYDNGNQDLWNELTKSEDVAGNHGDAMADYVTQFPTSKYCLTFADNSGCPLNQNALHGEMYFNGYGGIDNYCNNDDDDSYNTCGSGSGWGAMATEPWDEDCWECGTIVGGHKRS